VFNQHSKTNSLGALLRVKVEKKNEGRGKEEKKEEKRKLT